MREKRNISLKVVGFINHQTLTCWWQGKSDLLLTEMYTHTHTHTHTNTHTHTIFNPWLKTLIISFFYGLFNNAVRVSKYLGHNSRIRKLPGLRKRTTTESASKEWETRGNVYDVTMRRVHETIVAVEKQQVLHISMCVSLRARGGVSECVYMSVGARV